MEISEKELEKRLLDAGKSLLSPQLTSTELIKSLDLVENLLSEVEQSPSESMKEALAPSSKALVDNQLLKHSDADVRVAVASCISEITRITAPEAPYADDEMKEVFELIVSTFEKLDDISTSRTYTKRISILETVAKVRSCVVMLDLECDDLIVQMFQHFLRTIRDSHDKGVFSSMETIMALVLEESETIPTDLLFPMLDVLSKENKEVRPIVRQLAENVIANCTDKLKPYLLLAIRALDTSLDDYTKVVSDVYKARDEAVKPTDGDASNANLADNNDTINPSAEQADEVAMETLEDAPPSEEAGPTTGGASKTAVDNGVKDDEDSSAVNDNTLKTDNETQNEKEEPSKTNVDSSIMEEPPKKTKKKPKKGSKRKGKKQKASKSSSEPLEPAVSNQETADVDTPDHHDDSMDVDNLEGEDLADDTTDAANNAKSSEAPVLSPKASDNECADVSLPSPSGSHADETRSKKFKQEETKEDPIQEDETADEVDVGKESVIKKDTEEAAGSKNKPIKHAGKKSSSASDHEESAPVSADDSKKEDDNIHQLENSAVKDSAKEIEDDSLLADKKKRTQSKSTPAKGNKKTPAKDEKKKAVALPKSTPKVAKDESDAKETLKSSSKRKRPSEGKSPKSKVYDAGLVGATVKVYWQLDNEYYEGVVDSFDDVKKRHKIVYHDGDIEVLNLREEKWMVVSYPKGHAGDGDSPDSADEMPLRSKIKTSADGGGKTGKTGSSAKKSAGASSSKSKAASKSGSNDRKAASNSKEELTKKVGKSDTDKSGKSKSSKSGNKLSDDTPKSGKTLKDDDDLETVKGSSKSKQDTTKTATKSKGKSPKSVSKGKAGTTSTKDEDTEDDSVEPARTPEKSKTKSQSSSKSQNNSKKRKR